MLRTFLSLALACTFAVHISPSRAEDGFPKLAVEPVLDLQQDGTNIFAFCSASRVLFVSHPRFPKELRQWSLSDKRLEHTYLLPDGQSSWADAVVSTDGTVLVATTHPADLKTKTKVLFFDTRRHDVRFSAEYDYPIRHIRFDVSGKLVWLEPTWPGPDPFVYDLDGSKTSRFDPVTFTPKGKSRLWNVPDSKPKIPLPGLFFKDSKGNVHRLIEHSLGRDYAMTADGKYVGAFDIDHRRTRIWRTSDLKEVFNEEIGAYPVCLAYDSRDNQFLIADGIGGNTQLRAVKLPASDKSR